MPEDKIDSIARVSLKALQNKEKEASLQCLSDEELAEYADGILLGGIKKQEHASHIAECDNCFSRTASAIAALTSFNEQKSDSGHATAVEKAKSIPRLYRKRKASIMKRNKYLLVAAGFFMLSFIFKVYFLQFLVAASIFGLKWVMDTGGSKALIMVYDAWQQGRGGKGEEKGRRPSAGDRRI